MGALSKKRTYNPLPFAPRLRSHAYTFDGSRFELVDLACGFRLPVREQRERN